MNRAFTGALAGVGGTLTLGVALWWFGILQVAGLTFEPNDDGAAAMNMTPEEHAAMKLPASMQTPAEADMPADMDMPAADEGADAGPPPDAVMITPRRQQLIGVRTAVVTSENITRTIRTVGTVQYNETKVAHIHSRVTGWIEELYVDFTGKLVEQGQPLLGIYSPELVATQEEYLLALRAQKSLGSSPYAEVAQTTQGLLAATRRRLLLWNVTEEQIAELEERRAPQTMLTLFSPINGYVIHKNAYEGAYVRPDSELFTIADLSDVWVTADIYEQDLPYVSEGQAAIVKLSYLPGQTFRGRVDYVYPYLAGATRTATVRIVLDNPNGTLKPDMFADVELTARLGTSLVIPEDAVIDTGVRQVVFLVYDEGHFLPREVTIGSRFDGKLQVLAGLEAGDVVASGAAFLIDSESKLRSAVRGMGSMPGMDMSGHQH